ncbi:conserved hypothetical protein [Flavobacterium psychrophilum]|uniref:hypothetical protein n=1 Tax=Flavobacterium psychrophilum TaxID=96345 RepID=UPI00090315DD|nr:hypothetical protein [Flavobacterium psychrophilum]EKT3967289.1 hypothetical protein [Flavobacterium psychrophilum]ELY1979217.1 hypothetical protein [Flavobacterium psychrophilum]MCB6108179.1 hypothetical protein [Flavobacterium psychrophilum]OJH12432.1 hypothetical protein FPG87_01990 [Flavobacterium psychrophilum]SNB07048.1 conserved hypothetical protein [Flavobacterium psychrophilum]
MDTQIIYSPFTDTVKKQLKNKGLKFDKEEVKLIQEIAFSVMNLKFHEIISDLEADKMIAKIHKRLVKHLNENNVAQANASKKAIIH